MRESSRAIGERVCGILTQAQVDIICASLRAGHGQTMACVRAGVATTTYRRYVKRGLEALEDGLHDDYGSFMQQVQHAQADAVEAALNDIQSAAKPWVQRYVKKIEGGPKDGETETRETDQPGDWRAAAWWLEKMQPAQFGRLAEQNSSERAAEMTKEYEIVEGPNPKAAKMAREMESEDGAEKRGS